MPVLTYLQPCRLPNTPTPLSSRCIRSLAVVASQDDPDLRIPTAFLPSAPLKRERPFSAAASVVHTLVDGAGRLGWSQQYRQLVLLKRTAAAATAAGAA